MKNFYLLIISFLAIFSSCNPQVEEVAPKKEAPSLSSSEVLLKEAKTYFVQKSLTRNTGNSILNNTSTTTKKTYRQTLPKNAV